MRILAVDPGYDRLGIAVLERKDGREKLLFSECFSPPKKLADVERIWLSGQKIKKCIKKYKPQAVAIEKLFFNKNQKTAFLIAEVRGVIIYEALSGNLPVWQFTPLQIKIAVTGYGRSEKRQVSEMVKKLVKIDKKSHSGSTVAAQAGKILDDEYDAIAVGLTFFANNNKLSTEFKK